MGWRYIFFRIGHEWRRRTGLLAKDFPVNPPQVALPSLEAWKADPNKWVWQAKELMDIPRRPTEKLAQAASDVLEGKILLFNAFYHHFNKTEAWITNPETGFRYDNRQHWTKIADLSPEAGDIKYVWEKSRFAYLQTIVRYDYHFQQNHAEWVFGEMESWIAENPINCGPNYRCSQEISLRVFNWLGALTFYQNSQALTSQRWSLFMHHIYWQMHHVRQNIHFSRIAVRNNHAITETLALYIYGSLFAEMPGAKDWRNRGKDWLEEEIAYQVYSDGSYVQHSMNYQRVAVQLLTLAIRFAEIRGDRFSPTVYERAYRCLRFMRGVQDPVSGKLPNYGMNDGALFFQFTNKPYEVYTDQLNALGAAIFKTHIFNIEDSENSDWFGYARQSYINTGDHLPDELELFPKGGFAALKELHTLTFFRSGRFKDRPAQADNLHVDLWHNGNNLMMDGGLYKYNSKEEDIRYFFGSRSHNTVMVDGEDQMLKGPRFIWIYWSRALFLKVKETEEGWKLHGKIKAYRHLSKKITHERTVTKSKNLPLWTIEDRLTGTAGRKTELLWHPSALCLEQFDISVTDSTGKTVEPKTEIGWFSGLYGMKEEMPFLVYEPETPRFTTVIRPKAIE